MGLLQYKAEASKSTIFTSWCHLIITTAYHDRLVEQFDLQCITPGTNSFYVYIGKLLNTFNRVLTVQKLADCFLH